jgi:eukaryotic-like serine/threonine-protein kinase
LMVTPAITTPEVDRAWMLLASLDTVAPAPRRAYVAAEARLLVAGALARAGLVDSARRVIDRTRAMITAEIDPEQDLLSREAYVRSLMGDHDIAIDLLKRYVAANPGHGFAEQAGTVWWWRGLVTHRRWNEVAQPKR